MKSLKYILVMVVLIMAPLAIVAAEKHKQKLDSSVKVTGVKKSELKTYRPQNNQTLIKTQSGTGKSESGDTFENITGSPVNRSPEAGEQINWQVLSSGATDANSTSFHLLGTLGQVAAGIVTSASYSINQGYWQDFGPVIDGCCGLYAGGQTGNTTCDVDGKRNLADITSLIDHVYISKAELCCNENGNTTGDLDGKRNLADTTKLIDHVYISKTETAACE